MQKRRRSSARRPGAYETRLERWMHANGVTSDALQARSGLSRQWLTKLRWTRQGAHGVTLRTMRLILWAARDLRGPQVTMADLFDLEPDPILASDDQSTPPP